MWIRYLYIRDDFIETESTAHEAREIEGGFPGVVGLIDATHVYIRAPEHNIDAYINCKKFHSLGHQVKWTREEPSNNYVKPI